MKKNIKNFTINWKKAVIAVTLYNLILCIGPIVCAEELDNVVAEDSVGVVVHVKPEDAKRLTELNQLRRRLLESERKLALIELENKKLEQERQLERQRLIELINIYQKQNEQYRQLQLVLSGALASGEVRGTGEREEQLLKALSDITKDGEQLAVQTVKFCELIESLIRELPIGKVRQTELQLFADELKSKSRQLLMLTTASSDNATLEKCRIIAVNPELSVVVLPVGSVHGAFNGLVYYTGKSTTVLKVVSVRPFVAAAVLVSGKIDELTPGMEVATERISN